MNLRVSITVLSNLTKKTRPSIYKYINAYECKQYDDVPYSFIKLFDLMNDVKVTNREIIKYCEDTFMTSEDDELLTTINLLKEYRNKIDLKKIQKLIMEEIDNGK